MPAGGLLCFFLGRARKKRNCNSTFEKKSYGLCKVVAEKEGWMRAIHGPYPSGGLKSVQIGDPADLSNPEDSRVLCSLSRSH